MVLDDKEIAALMARKKAIQATLGAQQSGCAAGSCAAPGSGGTRTTARKPQRVLAAVAVAGALVWASVLWFF